MIEIRRLCVSHASVVFPSELSCLTKELSSSLDCPWVLLFKSEIIPIRKSVKAQGIGTSSGLMYNIQEYKNSKITHEKLS